jgi:hypothetical protein
MKTRVTKTRHSRAAGKPRAAKAIRSTAKRSQTKPIRAGVPASSPTTASDQKRPTGKLGQVLDAIAAKRGASLDELVALTGWQPHTTRAALTRLRQRGFPVGLHEASGRKAYHLTEAGPQ